MKGEPQRNETGDVEPKKFTNPKFVVFKSINVRVYCVYIILDITFFLIHISPENRCQLLNKVM